LLCITVRVFNLLNVSGSQNAVSVPNQLLNGDVGAVLRRYAPDFMASDEDDASPGTDGQAEANPASTRHTSKQQDGRHNRDDRQNEKEETHDR